MKGFRLAFFAGGNGSAMRAVYAAAASGILRSSVALLVTNRPSCGAQEWAHEYGIPVHLVQGDTMEEPVDMACRDALAERRIDLVLLTGYMRKLGPHVLRAYQPNILNTHPALLPKYGGLGMYGSRVHKAVLAAGETQSGASVHIVDENYDTGPIVRQRTTDIDVDETPESLASKIKAVEADLIVDILRDLERGSLQLDRGNP